VFLALLGALKAFESYAIQPSTMPQIPIQDIVLGVYLRQVSPKISGIPPEKIPWILSDLCYRNVKFTPNMMTNTTDRYIHSESTVHKNTRRGFNWGL
jgi:hypothetical protein